jgi:hypothetical protein
LILPEVFFAASGGLAASDFFSAVAAVFLLAGAVILDAGAAILLL